jgi:hypothetical protein
MTECTCRPCVMETGEECRIVRRIREMREVEAARIAQVEAGMRGAAERARRRGPVEWTVCAATR